MATVNAYSPIDMLNAQTWYGYVTNATSTNLTITDNYTTAYYSGYGFAYSGSNVVGGTLTGFSQYYMGSLQGSITGFSASAPLAASYIQSNNLPGLFKIALGGNDYFDLSNYDDLAVSYGGNDTIYARGGNDNIWGGEGADTIDGGDGYDYARYDDATSGVYARLDTGLGYSGEADGDTFKLIEGLVGSAYSDTLIGDAGVNALYGQGGEDWLYGLGGGDTLNGGDGYDYARYDYATSGVYARLDTGLGYSGEADGDTFKLIEGLVGSAYSDTLIGDAGVNALFGQGGEDSLYGLGGNDWLVGGAGNDVLDGGADDDTAVFTQALANYSVRRVGTNITVSGPDGSDVLSNIEHLGFADIAINLNAGDSIVTAPGGNSNFDGGAGTDIISFDFKLTDATISSLGNHLIVNGPNGSHSVLTGFETFVFTDGTVNDKDGDPLVDDLFYYSHNHDVWNAHVDADQHYHQSGWHEGRDPNGFFSTSFYLSLNQDVKQAGVDPLVHFDQAGWREGRQPSAAFDDGAYLAANPDVAAAGINPLAHFLQSGQSEGRQATALTSLIGPHGFDSVFYLQHNPDVQAAEIDPFQHYQNFGWKEGRNPNALFDAKGYLNANPDVANAHINPLDHYDQHGWREGRDPSTAFDTSEYLSHYPDVAAAHIDPLVHYLQHGIHEGRQTFADGLWV